MVLEYLPTNWDYFKLLSWGQWIGKYSSTMDPLGLCIDCLLVLCQDVSKIVRVINPHVQ